MSTYRTSCGETLEKLPLYVGGDLDGEAQSAVRAHLEVCAPCASRARSAQRAREALTRALHPPGERLGGPSLWPGVRSALAAEGRIQGEPLASAAPFARARAGSRVRWLAPLAAAAALVAVLQGTGLLERVEPAKDLPVVPQVAAPENPHGGMLQRIAPHDVEPLVPFQAPRQHLGNGGWLPGSVSTAGYRSR